LVGEKPPVSEEPDRRATGSGVIVTPQGRVVTNHHVVDGAVEVKLVTRDQRRWSATVIGSDARTDLAILQIDAEGSFPWLPWADSASVRVGQPVLAVGSPFDFQSTVTMGIVSATGRRGLSGSEVQDYLQTDTAVNPGNSGGPLVNLNGQIVGINTAIYSQGPEQNSGVSFAIPASMARRLVAELEATGRVARSRLGVEAEDVEVDGLRGAQVVLVVPSSPASAAGLRRGDVVVEVDGEPCPSADSLAQIVRARPIGARTRLKVMRGSEALEVVAIIADAREVGVGPASVTGYEWSGMVLVPEDRALRAALGVPEAPGALVARVEPGSAAAILGVRAGDRVVEVRGRAVSGVLAAQTLLMAADLGPLPIMLDRAGTRVITILPPPRAAESGR
jgi:S1-C subfamily serine protease